MDKTVVINALKLVAIVLVAVLCLSVVYETTKNVIAAAVEEEKLESFKKVFPGAESFNKLEYEFEKGSDGIDVLDALEAIGAGGEREGIVLSISNPSDGYGGEIVISLGIDNSGSITGMTVTSMNETPGLGANCTEEEFQSQFTGLKDFPIVYVKDGKDAPNEIDAISGATKTTNAVTNTINFAHTFALDVFGIGGAK